jgi:hypothetical protein
MRHGIRLGHWMADVGQDVRFAARLFAKDRWFTLVVVVRSSCAAQRWTACSAGAT